MGSYHVYFTPKTSVSREALLARVHEFMKLQITGNRAQDYRILDMKNKATFPDLPDYHLIVDYETEGDVQQAFEEMKKNYREEPHAQLMRMVSDFRVAFSTDVR